MEYELKIHIDKEVAESAMEYSTKNGTSIDELVRNYLMGLSAKTDGNASETRDIREIVGILKVPENFNYKEELANALTEKFLK